MAYIKKNRETKISTDIKRVYNEKPSSAKKGDGNGHDDGSDGDSDADE
jgi:hypothetical protein